MSSQRNPGNEPIAIIGSSCRFPGGASSPSKLWELLLNPRDLRQEIPQARFNTKGFFHENPDFHGSTNVTHSYLCDEDPWVFDHSFFNIHPREAECMDPQQRIMLELVYESLESAGYSMDKLKGSQTGVFLGQMTDDFYDLLFRDVDNLPKYAGTGMSRAITANRISYFFDWKGPSVNIDTACSSSLVGLHQAVQSLRSGETEFALVGGVNLILGPERYITESKLRMLSPNGRSRMWDADADGYARGEGFATVFLKPLRQAVADNDHIECVIRETGVNQDGQSTGLTVPSPASQTALITSTYERSGLDPQSSRDRCQYFEAHGTGTPAGDPKEAEAIRNTFFPEHTKRYNGGREEPLYVGSVKTVIGHSEGTAGLASLLKASLAIQNAQIPPNMLFRRLNPAIEPFYQNLHVPTSARPWPEVAPGCPRRASVNSFGFGGTNAHAILESWDPESPPTLMPTPTVEKGPKNQTAGPFLLSAHSQSALSSMVVAVSHKLKTESIDLSDLAWTLQSRRTEFPHRAYFSGSTREQLAEALDAYKAPEHASKPPMQVSQKHPLRILGVFTGQGAQWPSMGAGLYETSAVFRATMKGLDHSLQTLPDPPSWTLVDEMRAPVHMSKVHWAEISQPLTTAIQIALVDLVRACGLGFRAVVGHSSGEIAAAYVSGYLTASDAVRVAYYRGLHSRHAGRGRMMAAGMTQDEAEAFCRRPELGGGSRIRLAACNSGSSVTLSGDADAIEKAKALLDAEKTFARLLKVETAYHSHHMDACAEPYLESMRRCGVSVQSTSSTEGGCTWYSSVFPGSDGRSVHEPHPYQGAYWVSNMTHPVLFSQAIERAVGEDTNGFDMAIEVGPHPALKGPALENLKSLTGLAIPYCGLLSRGGDDTLSFHQALGFVWKSFQFPAPLVDFAALQGDQHGQQPHRRPRLVKGLDPYPWDHGRVLWKESRRSQAWRASDRKVHGLLGRLALRNSQELLWRTVFKLEEMEWLRGHQFQHQPLFPAAGFLSMAVEACVEAADDGPAAPVKLIELHDVKFIRAITLEDDGSGKEVSFSMTILERDAAHIEVRYYCSSGDVDAIVTGGRDTTTTIESSANFTGLATIFLGEPADDVLPPRCNPATTGLPLTDVDTGRFYDSILQIGLDYSGAFRADSIQRRFGAATVSMVRPRNVEFRLDPQTLDAAFHGLFAAFSFPGDGRMWAPYLPSHVDRVRVDMRRDWTATAAVAADTRLVADCFVQDSSAKVITGDVDIFASEDDHAEVQIQGITCSSFSQPTPKTDRKLFARTVWRQDMSAGLERTSGRSIAMDPIVYDKLLEGIERTCYFFLRRLLGEVQLGDEAIPEQHFHYLMEWAANKVLPAVNPKPAAGRMHGHIKAEWADDTYEAIMDLKNELPECITLDLIHSVGINFPSIVRGTVPALQVLLENQALNRMYKEGLGFPEVNPKLGQLVSQLSHRYPRMNILEIGSGTGSATTAILEKLGHTFASFTFTDISAGYFEEARSAFAHHYAKMRYQVLDIERPPGDQGFQEHSYDLIIASNVLHATKSLANTMRNCRKLLRPGGYLFLLEVTGDMVYQSFLMGGLPGWWLGRDDGRMYRPTISEQEWDALLRDTGFSGTDYLSTSAPDNVCRDMAVMATQAVDARVNLLRNPLMNNNDAESSAMMIRKFVMVGGHSRETSDVANAMLTLLKPRVAADQVSFSRLEEIGSDALQPGCSVICLTDLEQDRTFETMTDERLRSLQSVFNNATHVFWATRGYRVDDPYASMSVGVCRAVAMESPHLKLQCIDFDDSTLRDPKMVASVLCRSFVATQQLLMSPGSEDILWSIETEVALEDGVLYIPRIITDKVLNRQVNAARRVIEEDVALSSQPVTALHHRDGSLFLEKKTDRHHLLGGGGDGNQKTVVEIDVLWSSLFALSPSDADPVYICLGSLVGKTPRQLVLALSPTNSSRICVPISWAFSWKEGDDATQENRFRTLLAAIQCECILAQSSSTTSGGTTWIHDAPASFAKILSEMAESEGRDLFLSSSLPPPPVTTGAADVDGDNKVIITYIHPHTSKRALESLAPRNLARFIDMGTTTAGDGTDRRHHPRLSPSSFGHAKMESWRRWTEEANANKQITLGLSLDQLRRILKLGALNTTGVLLPDPSHLSPEDVIDVKDIGSGSSRGAGRRGCDSIISWREASVVSVRIVQPSYQGMFSADKTYFLVGLRSELGASLCEWMIRHGARNFALASRTPPTEGEADESAPFNYLRRRLGARIDMFALDVSDKAALVAVHRRIKSSMPPVAGVVNAAMVLRDRPFANMTLDDFAAVTRPKVDGTRNLDDVFRADEDQHPLDFFVVFGSMSAVLGNKAQAAYAAANMYMSTLMAQRRRRRGLAASVLNIAMLMGLGYVARSSRTNPVIEAQLRKFKFLAISEPEFHCMFAEAVRAGRPGYAAHDNDDDDGELLCGFGGGLNEELEAIPRLWHDQVGEDDAGDDDGNADGGSGGDGSSKKRSSASTGVLSQLSSTKSPEETVAILEEAFSSKLGQLLQTPVEGLERNAPLVALGIDSLVAVEIRSWILKELRLEVPVLKLLGGLSVGDISREAAATLAAASSASPTTTNGIGSGGTTTTTTATTTTAKNDKLGTGQGKEDNGPAQEPGEQPQGSNNGEVVKPATEPTPPPKTTTTVTTTTDGSTPGYIRMGPMSHSQARLYFLHTYIEDKSTNNVGYYGKYHGRPGTLDVAKLEAALQLVCTRHESLRSSYFIAEDAKNQQTAMQAVNPQPRIVVEHLDVASDDEYHEAIEQARRFVLDIENGILLKVIVLSQPKGGGPSRIIFLHHHVAMDGSAWQIFMRDLDHAYKGLVRMPLQQQQQQQWSLVSSQTASNIPQMIDVCNRQHQQLALIAGDKSRLAFWRQLHNNSPQPLPLFPFSKTKSRRLLRRYETVTVDCEMPGDLARQIKSAASKLYVTPFHLHLSTVAFLLTKCLDVHDFGVGIVDGNRDEGSAEAIGCFLNMLPLRFQLNNSDEFGATTRDTRDKVLAALANSTPFDVLLDNLQVGRSGTHHPLFQVAFNYRNMYGAHAPLGDGSIEWEGSILARNPYDMAFDVTELPSKKQQQRAMVHLTVQSDLYTASDAEQILQWYMRALEGLARDPSTRVSNCPVANSDDLLRAYALGQGEPLPAATTMMEEEDWDGKTTTLVSRFDEMSRRYPDSVAVKDGYGNRLTYAQTRMRSLEIAAQIDGRHGKKIAPGSHVAMLLHPMADHVCCMLAVLRLGLVWVPLDLKNPHGRLQAMVSDCRPRVIVCNKATMEQARKLVVRSANGDDTPSSFILDLDENVSSSAQSVHPDNRQLDDVSSPGEPAVILYTSGSTGVPKGVVLSHTNLASHIRTHSKQYNLSRETVLQQSSLGFDLSLDQTWTALANGGKLIIVHAEGRGDPVHLAETMLSERVTYTLLVTSEYISLLNYGAAALTRCKSWRLAFCLGEKLTPQLRRAFQELDPACRVQLVNSYGPTEATISCAKGAVPYRTDEDVAYAGDLLRPMPGPLPVGFPGEICIVSDTGLALGYLNRPEETRRSYVETDLGLPGQCPVRLYRTGDSGRLRLDGTLDIFGRIKGDKQVKVRGHRVELDEIANVVVQRAGPSVLTNAAVSYRAEQDILVAFVVFRTSFSGSKGAFADYLKTDLPLPRYMVPDFIVPVDEIPTNLNGKEDGKAVEQLSFPGGEGSRSAGGRGDNSEGGRGNGVVPLPLPPVEQRIKGIWEEVLEGRIAMSSSSGGVITPDSDFFHLGGNSMLAVKLRSALKRDLGVTVPLFELFQSSTLRQMAAACQSEAAQQQPVVGPQDWDQEINSLLDLLPSPSQLVAAQTPSPPASPPGLNVVLTGATGFLGTHILEQLISHDQVARIHCVAIRPSSSSSSSSRLSISSLKVVPYAGDLSDPDLGLSPQQFDFLSRTTDVIIHNGASVSYLHPYRSLRAPNVLSTVALCRLALPRRVPLHYVSTAGVAGLVLNKNDNNASSSSPSPLPELPIPSSRIVPPPVVSSNNSSRSASPAPGQGYALSKWVSEALLQRVSSPDNQYRLPVVVHRPSHITFSSSSTTKKQKQQQPPDNDLVASLMRYSRVLGAVPVFGEELQGQIDMIDVDSVAGRLVENALTSKLTTTTAVPLLKFTHHSGEVLVAPGELRAYLEGLEEKRREFEELSIGEWLERAKGKGMDLLMYEFLVGAFRGEDKGSGGGRRSLVLPMLERPRK
ncbi:hypothetical protein DL767_006979 [Monosporascus sp. MG133]|nr:hypothetical protein DL767_006979 [Monosporascus sp. MG133]